MEQMKRYLTMIVNTALLLTALGVVVQTGEAASPSVYIRAETYRFPAVLEGTEVEHTFKLKNSGDGQLDILNVRTD